MANIVITSKGVNGIYVDFGVYEDDSLGLFSPQGFNSAFLTNVYDDGMGVCAVMEGRNSQKWCVHYTATTGYMIIDSIDGVTPTSVADLVEKLTALL